MSGKTAIVLGGGVGGVVAASNLRRWLPKEDRVVLIERSGRHVFWPSLLWLMTGTRKAQDVQRDIAALKQPGIDVLKREVTRIDPGTRTVYMGGSYCSITSRFSGADESLQGDALVIALGAQLAPDRIPGLSEGGHNFYTVEGAAHLYEDLLALREGRVVVLIAGVPFKCPAAPYEAAMLIDHLLRKRGVRDRVELEVWAAEPAPMGVAGPAVSQGVKDLIAEHGIAYHPGKQISKVDAAKGRLHFASGEEVPFDVLAVVPPHVPPAVAQEAGLTAPGGWVEIDRESCETRFENVFAIGDVTGVMLAMGKPLPKAGVFAHAQAEAVAKTIAARWAGKGEEGRFSGNGECFIETGSGIAGFARGNFYAEPAPEVKMFRTGRHWHVAKVAFEKNWWRSWF